MGLTALKSAKKGTAKYTCRNLCTRNACPPTVRDGCLRLFEEKPEALQKLAMPGSIAWDPNEVGTLLGEDIADMIGETCTSLAVEVECGVNSQRAEFLHFVIKLGDGGNDAFEAVALECLSGVQIRAVLGHGENDQIDSLLELHAFQK